MLALEPGGPQRLSSVPRFDPATKAALVDQIDPASLGEALRKLSGQTVLVTGRVEGDTLAFVAATGGAEQKVFLRKISAAAEASDVNLVVVQASGPRQPGGRNWLWQKVGVAGLDEAMKRIRRAIKRHKREPQFFVTQARVLVAQGKGAKAAKALERARALAKDGERQRYDVKLIRLREQLAAVEDRR